MPQDPDQSPSPDKRLFIKRDEQDRVVFVFDDLVGPCLVTRYADFQACPVDTQIFPNDQLGLPD